MGRGRGRGWGRGLGLGLRFGFGNPSGTVSRGYTVGHSFFLSGLFEMFQLYLMIFIAE